MELKPIENFQHPNTKPIAKLYQNKKLIKKFLFEKEILKLNEQKSIDKENVLNEKNIEISQISIKNPKIGDLSSQKISQKNEETQNPIDFREEIEKRFKKSVVNKIYIFPRKTDPDFFFENSSSDSSNNSLKRVEIYNLKFQKPKEIQRNIKENEQEKKNMSFQDFLSKMQEEKDKWKPKPNSSCVLKKTSNNQEETLKRPIKTSNINLANNNNVKNVESLMKVDRSNIEKHDEASQKEKGNFSMIFKRPTEDKTKVKVIKGRKIVDLNQSKPRMNASGSNSKRKDNSSSNIFYAINSFHNKLFPKEKSKKESSFQDFLQRKCNKKHISELIFKNSMISNALKTDNNNLQNNPLYSKAKKQILIEKEYKNLYRSVEGLNCLKEKVLTENYVSTQSPKQQNKLGAFSDENRCRKEINVGKKKENNLQKSYDISKNSFKDFLMEHSQDQDNNKTDRMIVLQNYLKENKDHKYIQKV